MTKRLVPFVACSLMVLGGAGCRDILDVESSDYAIFTVAATPDESEFTTRPVGLFFEATDIVLSTSRVTTETCETHPYPAAVSVPELDYLDAGTSVTARLSGQTGELVPMIQNGLLSYTMAPGSSITYTPGDTLELEIPGATDGFAGLTVRAKTAEAFVPAPITIDPDLSFFQITWSPAASDNQAAMFYEFRYSTPSSTTLNRQIGCYFVDDGSTTLDPNQLIEFNESDLRQVQATRIRVSVSRTGQTVSHVTSTFASPVSVTVVP